MGMAWRIVAVDSRQAAFLLERELFDRGMSAAVFADAERARAGADSGLIAIYSGIPVEGALDAREGTAGDGADALN